MGPLPVYGDLRHARMVTCVMQAAHSILVAQFSACAVVRSRLQRLHVLLVQHGHPILELVHARQLMFSSNPMSWQFSRVGILSRCRTMLSQTGAL
jgi:hypothetical protein